MLKRPWLFIVLAAMALAGLFSQTASHEPFEETLVRLEVERALPALEPTLQEESASKSAAGGTMSHRIPMSWVTQT